jgi:hypothetical protein
VKRKTHARPARKTGGDSGEVEINMKPSHRVCTGKLAQLAWMINKAIDNGNYDLSIAEVRKAAEEERVLQFVRENLPTHRLLDLSLFTPEDEKEINRWFNQTNGNHDGKIEQQGLCLLLAWTIELMQYPDESEMAD